MTEKERKTAILDRCPNYNNISNYVYLENDYFSKSLIDLYQDYVFSINIDNQEELNLLDSVNKAMEKYIKDYNFAKALKNYLKDYNMGADVIIKDLMQKLVTFVSIYEEESLKHISNTKWI
jgi:hypothetical protein